MRTVICAIAAAAAFAGVAQAQVAPATDWSAQLEGDARALHRVYLDSHPGAVDSENPTFRVYLDRGLATALTRARTARSFADYFWAMREYVAGFDDVHVQFTTTPEAPKLDAAWPGFLTREEDGVHRVAAREDGPDAPPLGAALVACDGRATERLAADLVGRWRGLWNLAATHDRHAWRLFLDAQNAYQARPERCDFAADGTTRTWTLRWRPLPEADLQARAKDLTAPSPAPIEMRTIGPGRVWISAGSFTSDASSPNGKALVELGKRLDAERRTLASAQVVVLDVRGNGGGSSYWGDRIAASIWGGAAAKAAKPSSEGVDWRVSDANIAELAGYRTDEKAPMLLKLWAGRIESGLRKAKAEGRPLWREGGGGSRAARTPVAIGGAGRKVFVLTDSTCASACLDALDVWLELGAVHVGRETSADSPYMEIRQETLPSGLARISVPMKVYRGRPRGANQPYRPAHRFSAADLRDTAALEAKILALAGAPESRP